MSLAMLDIATADPGALERDWDALWRRVPAASPFQSPAWMLPWWRQFGTARPIVVALRAGDGRLDGLLPAYVLEEGGERKLLPMGAGPTDYLDALVAPDAPAGTASLLLGAALEGAGAIDACDLPDLPPCATLREAVAPPGWTATQAQGAPCPVLVLPRTADGLREIVPAATRRKLRMNRHRAERAGGAALRVAEAATWPAMLDALADLHGARWAARGEPGVLADPLLRRFLDEAAPLLLGAGLLRLATLHIGDGAVAAACLALATPDRLLLYLSGFDAAQAFYSPGTLLLGALIEAAISEGIGEVHFLRGGEAYKYAWGATDRFNLHRRLARS